MSSSEYWKKRFEQLEQSLNQQGIECYEHIEKQYRQAQQQIENELSKWYWRLAKNNGISMQEARKLLTSNELKEFKWTVEDYIDFGKENAINNLWMKELENASAKYHISRLEAIKIQTQQHLEVLFGNQLDSIDTTMRDIYAKGYYHTAFEIQKGIGVGWNFNTLDERKISKVINNPWAADGKNFSQRIWGNRQKLINELNTELTKNIILGRDPQKAIDAIAKKMNVSKNNAGALVMTEQAFFSSAAQKDCFTELDVEEFEVVATLDSHTSETCRKMDGKHFPMSQWEVGTTAPPFHVRCRSTTVPYFEDDFGVVGKRAARDEEGKTYYVPANMTYEKWEKAIVKGDKSGLIQAPKIKDEKIRKANKEFGQILMNNVSTPYNDKMILYNEATEYLLNKNTTAPFQYNMDSDVIEYNPSAPNYSLYDMNFVQAHELSHRIDILEIHSWKNQKFIEAVENSRKKVYDNSTEIAEWFSVGGKYEDDMALSDIISALSEGELNDILCSGHKPEYWKENISNSYLEIFANMASIDILDYDSKAEFDGILEELYQVYKEMTE